LSEEFPAALPEPELPAPVTPPRRAALAFIFVTVVLDVLALGLVIPVLPKLVESFLGGDTAAAAHVYGLFGTLWAAMQFVFSPLLGALSDRFGRRPIILLSNFGLGLDYILMALAPTLGWLFVGRVISGIVGASWTTAAAYLADVTKPEERAASFGRIGAAWGLGFVLGPALGGVLGGIDARLPFAVAAGLTLLNAAYGLFVLPESLPRERRGALDLRRANPLGSLGLLRGHKGLLPLASVAFLFWMAHQVLQSVFVLYTGYRYAWAPTAVGLTLGGVGLCSMAVQAGLVKPLVRRFGERKALMTALGCGALGYLAWGLAPTGAWFRAAIPVFSLMGLHGPSMQSLMSRRVAPTEQGRLQGAYSSIMGITGMLGPSLFTGVFAAFIGPRADLHLPGAPFLLATAFMLVALLVAWRGTRVRAPVAAPAPSIGT
jgi:MFS transporter, DHA1 family, tetracycline resistance protein